MLLPVRIVLHTEIMYTFPPYILLFTILTHITSTLTQPIYQPASVTVKQLNSTHRTKFACVYSERERTVFNGKNKQ